MTDIFKWTLALFLLISTACLRTRSEIEEVEQRKAVQQQVSSLQKNTADSQARFNEFNEDIRSMNGRIETLENRIMVMTREREKNQAVQDQQLAENNKKIRLLQEEVQKLETQINFLKEEFTKQPVAAPSRSTGKKVDYFQLGEDAMAKKEWKEAILNLQKYRDKSPNGKKYSTATYKIGQAFYELGMKEEAKTFFEEVVSKFPDSPFAKSAKDRLKKIK
jgi:TolA-binding protein